MSSKKTPSERYAAKLLFQFRVVVGRRSNKRRTCEERLVIFRATHAKGALTLAKRYGAKQGHAYKNSAGNVVHFEFVGVMELLHLGVECEEDEVWYNITERLQPMERAKGILPLESELNAMRGP